MRPQISLLSLKSKKKCKTCLKEITQNNPLQEEPVLDSSFILVGTEQHNEFNSKPIYSKYFSSAALSNSSSPFQSISNTPKTLNHSTVGERRELQIIQRGVILVDEFLDTLHPQSSLFSSISLFSNPSPTYYDNQENTSKLISSVGHDFTSHEENQTNLMEWINDTVCPDCKIKILTIFEDRLSEREKEVEKERALYENQISDNSFIKNIEPSNSIQKSNFLEEEEELRREVESLEKELNNLSQEVLSLEFLIQDSEKILLDHGEKEYLLNKNMEEQFSLRQLSNHHENQIKLFPKYPFKNFLFHFDLNQTISSINGCRFGTTSAIRVPWDEINSAWGHVATLFNCIVFKNALYITHGSSNYLNRYQIIPRGMRSSIVDDGQDYPLWGTAEFQYSISRLLWVQTKSEFDCGICSFLNFFKCFLEEMRIIPPHDIEGDKVGGTILTTSGNTEENWTVACKKILSNLEYLYRHLL